LKTELDKYFDERGRSLTPRQPTYVPMARISPLVTEGRYPAVDALAICAELLSELKPFERQAIVAYLQSTVYA
jgi:hypothetical protein